MEVRTLAYASKCYWPGVTEAEVAEATRRAGAECAGTILFPRDDLVLGLFTVASPGDARHISECAGMPCERVMQAVLIWMALRKGGPR
jgi:hypothetical protein